VPATVIQPEQIEYGCAMPDFSARGVIAFCVAHQRQSGGPAAGVKLDAQGLPANWRSTSRMTKCTMR
jgi:hypothetical protein